LEGCLDLRETAAVVTTPDRPKGRGLQVQSNAVKMRAEKAGVPVYAPTSLKKDAGLEKKISALKPDLFVTASYGKLIPSSLLRIPKIAPLNVHPSLLPKYRGAAPIPWQIINGEKETGVSIALMTEALDAGDIVHQIRIPLQNHETAESLSENLSHLARKALEEILGRVERGDLPRTPQKESESSYARKLTKEDGFLNLAEPAELLDRKIRAFHPWPGAFIGCEKKPLRILEAKADLSNKKAEPGELLEIHSEGYLKVQTGGGSLKILRAQLPGRRPVSGLDLANGLRLKAGFVFQ